MGSTRPSDGFKIGWPQSITDYLAALCEQHPGFDRHWDDTLSRLRLLAHRDGFPAPDVHPLARVVTYAASRSADRPRIVAVYTLASGVVSLRKVSVLY